MTLTRSPSVRIKLGIWSTLSAMLLSLVVISGCNDEGTTTSTPATNPAPAPSTTKPAETKKPDTAPPPPSTPKAEEKKS